MKFIIYNIYINNKIFNLHKYNNFIWKNKTKKKIPKNLLFTFFKLYYYIHNLKKFKHKSNIKRLNMYLIYNYFNKTNNKTNNNINISIYNIYNILLNNINIIY